MRLSEMRGRMGSLGKKRGGGFSTLLYIQKCTRRGIWVRVYGYFLNLNSLNDSSACLTLANIRIQQCTVRAIDVLVLGSSHFEEMVNRTDALPLTSQAQKNIPSQHNESAPHYQYKITCVIKNILCVPLLLYLFRISKAKKFLTEEEHFFFLSVQVTKSS